MTAIFKSIRKIEDKFDRCAERFSFHHPYLAFFAMFAVMPAFILLVVAACTTVITLPMAWILEWL